MTESSAWHRETERCGITRSQLGARPTVVFFDVKVMVDPECFSIRSCMKRIFSVRSAPGPMATTILRSKSRGKQQFFRGNSGGPEANGLFRSLHAAGADCEPEPPCNEPAPIL